MPGICFWGTTFYLFFFVEWFADKPTFIFIFIFFVVVWCTPSSPISGLICALNRLPPGAFLHQSFVPLLAYVGKCRCALQDLAVQREGTFILRYRAFDIYSTAPGGQDHPILAELYGGPFRVYSTREFPGLEPSTDLTRVCGFYLMYWPL